MVEGLAVFVFFGQTKVNQVADIRFAAKAHEEVVRLDVPVDVVLRVDVFDSRDLLKNEA